VHDFDLGINPYPNGLFWTVAIPPDSVQANIGAGSASYHVANQPALDYGNIPNALLPPHTLVTTVTLSWDIEWFGPTRRHTTSEPNVGFSIDAVLTSAVMDFTATTAATSTTPGTTFVSDPASACNMKSVFAEVGREKNGVFFHS
jgi:hypothetical protein